MDCNHIVLLLNTVTVAIHRVCYCTTSHEVKQPHVWSDRENLSDSSTVTSRALKCSFTRATKLIVVRCRYLTVRRIQERTVYVVRYVHGSHVYHLPSTRPKVLRQNRHCITVLTSPLVNRDVCLSSVEAVCTGTR